MLKTMLKPWVYLKFLSHPKKPTKPWAHGPWISHGGNPVIFPSQKIAEMVIEQSYAKITILIKLAQLRIKHSSFLAQARAFKRVCVSGLEVAFLASHKSY